MNYVCHSGGCPGSDMMWENESFKYGVKTIAYSFRNHIQNSKNPKILSVLELEEGFQAIQIANNTLKKNIEDIIYPYIKNLLSRNWFQVKNSESIFAVGILLDCKTVSGGTGWTVQMAIDNNKDTFVFDQKSNNWNKFNYDLMEFEIVNYIPKLTQNFAGIGTRELNDNGKAAIEKILDYNLNVGIV